MIKKICITLFGMMFLTAASLFALSGRDIMKKVSNANNAQSTHSLVTLKLIDKNGGISSRVIEMFAKKNSRDESRSLIIFHSPASVKNTRFLSLENKGRDNDQWIYLPALKRVRRIAASEGDKPFMGTDLTYNDMGARNIDDDIHTLTGEKTLGGRKCYVVTSVPKTPGTSQYSKRISWIDTERMIPLRMELYDTEGKLIKIMLMKNIKKIQGEWTPMTTSMENVQTHHKTVITMTKLLYNETLPDGIFTTRFLQTGRL